MPSPPSSHQAQRFGVVVPVKPALVAKSRLGGLGDAVRRELVTAFAVDTVVAAHDCPAVGAVLVVTDDVVLARTLDEFGVVAIPDGRPGLLNESLRLGAAELVRRRPDLRPVALCADLPALRSADLAEVLANAPGGPTAFVADAAGVGTTLYTAASVGSFEPRFGERSRDAHMAAGATELGAPASVRTDVDTPEELRAAAGLGLGARTSWVVTRFRL
jgi:2-phospho-L-lactate/phosphoenolpyruvate guanylyltransferase